MPSSEYRNPVIAVPPSLATDTLITTLDAEEEVTAPNMTGPGSVVVAVRVSDHAPLPISLIAITK